MIIFSLNDVERFLPVNTKNITNPNKMSTSEVLIHNVITCKPRWPPFVFLLFLILIRPYYTEIDAKVIKKI